MFYFINKSYYCRITTFDKDPYLERVYLTGQVSNFRKRPTHQYFSLKDDHAVIQATIW
ncbi:exodeoxyribonuclease VII large subunit, partial [Streptococcus mitis]|uniref:exodeoxyribonuclease VII large subunit n=1 Tax=Streptococcus mitis TaxID=28037 RepID=UPI0039C20AC4